MKRLLAPLILVALLFGCGQPADTGIHTDEDGNDAAHDSTGAHGHDDGHTHDEHDH